MNTGYLNLAPTDDKQFDTRSELDFHALLFIMGCLVCTTGWWAWGALLLMESWLFKRRFDNDM